MKPRRELLAAVLLCVLGAAMMLLAAGRNWVRFAAPTDRTVAAMTSFAKGESGSLIRAFGLAALAGVVGIAAARGRGRIAVGAVLAVVGTAAALVALRAAVDPEPLAGAIRLRPSGAPLQATGWPWVALAGGLVVAVAGAIVVARGPRWSALSQRYETPQGASVPATSDAGLWDALTRGDDPT